VAKRGINQIKYDKITYKANPMKRIIIEKVFPEINNGRFPIKRVVGDKVLVKSHIYADGHDEISARLLFKRASEKKWNFAEMRLLYNDEWLSEFAVEKFEDYFYTVEAWIDDYKTLRNGLEKKYVVGQDVSLDIQMAAEALRKRVRLRGGNAKMRRVLSEVENSRELGVKVDLLLSKKVLSFASAVPCRDSLVRYANVLRVSVDREKAAFSAWYEMFPRSCGENGRHGTFRDCEKLLPDIARMGFDVLYFPPIHPIGEAKRKGKNNSLVCGKGDVGSPWAIGSRNGGHKSVHPALGNVSDFKRLVKKASAHGLEIALDLAFQCAPDHPCVKEHPQWFKWRPDGSVQYAENPPKKYEDIVPFDFDTKNYKQLWRYLKDIVEYWLNLGVRIFRVDNPHTKPFVFWQWLIGDVKKRYPEVIFLSEAFTRPKKMYMLAKLGFSQSYTYFAWRNTKKEITDYVNELTQTEVSEFFRPNFWPNTPDILTAIFQDSGRPAFLSRFALAATLSSNYGIYGPCYELCVNTPLRKGSEEYLNSEKYEIRNWDRNAAGNIKDFISRINRIRKGNKSFWRTNNVSFLDVDNDLLIAYMKGNELIVVVSLDCYFKRSGWLNVPLEKIGLAEDAVYTMHDLLTGAKYKWKGRANYVELSPDWPAHIFRIET